MATAFRKRGDSGPNRTATAAVAVGAVLVALAPLLVGIATRAGSDWFPIHDLAVIDLRVRDVWSSDVPLLGAYSRYGWSHPGPVMFYLLALPSALFGQAAWATLVGGIVVQTGLVVWLAVLAWRIGRLGVVLPMMALTVLSYRAIGPEGILAPWNPYLAYPAFALFVLYVWRVALGETQRIAGLVIVASLLVQLHVGYALFVLGGLAAIGASALLDRRSRSTNPPRWRVSRRTVIGSATAMVVLWAPVALDTALRPPGNGVELLRYFVGGQASEPTAGLGAALGLLGVELSVAPPWIAGPQELALDLTVAPASPAWFIVAVALLAGGWYAARRTGRSDDVRLVSVVAVMAALGILSLARVTGDLVPYLFAWRTPLVLLIGYASARAVLHLVVVERPPATAVRLLGAATCAIALLAGALVTGWAVATHPDDLLGHETATRELVGRVPVDEVRGSDVLVRFRGTVQAGVEGGVIDWLDRRGVRVRVDEDRAFQFGFGRAANDGPVQVWEVIESGVETSMAAADPATRFVARLTLDDAAQEAELVTLHQRLVDQLAAAGRGDQTAALDSPLAPFVFADVPTMSAADLDRLADINEQLMITNRCRCAIVEVSPP